MSLDGLQRVSCYALSATSGTVRVVGGPRSIVPRSYVDSAVTSVTDTIAALTTDDIAEGTALYHTTARARQAISAGTGLTYDSATGVMAASGGAYLPIAGGTLEGALTIPTSLTIGYDTANAIRLLRQVGAALGVSITVDAYDNFVSWNRSASESRYITTGGSHRFFNDTDTAKPALQIEGAGSVPVVKVGSTYGVTSTLSLVTTSNTAALYNNGSSMVLSYADEPLMTFTAAAVTCSVPLTMTGKQTIMSKGPALRLNGENHCFIEWYSDGITRDCYMGRPSGLSPYFDIVTGTDVRQLRLISGVGEVLLSDAARVTGTLAVDGITTLSKTLDVTYQGGDQIRLQRSNGAYVGMIGINSGNHMFIRNTSGEADMRFGLNNMGTFWWFNDASEIQHTMKLSVTDGDNAEPYDNITLDLGNLHTTTTRLTLTSKNDVAASCGIDFVRFNAPKHSIRMLNETLEIRSNAATQSVLSVPATGDRIVTYVPIEPIKQNYLLAFGGYIPFSFTQGFAHPLKFHTNTPEGFITCTTYASASVGDEVHHTCTTPTACRVNVSIQMSDSVGSEVFYFVVYKNGASYRTTHFTYLGPYSMTFNFTYDMVLSSTDRVKFTLTDVSANRDINEYRYDISVNFL